MADALHKSGADLFYYKREDSTLEEDFFLRTKDSLVPVEVKAGNKRSQSLNTLIKVINTLISVGASNWHLPISATLKTTSSLSPITAHSF